MDRFDLDTQARLITISNMVDELRAALDGLMAEPIPMEEPTNA